MNSWLLHFCNRLVVLAMNSSVVPGEPFVFPFFVFSSYTMDMHWEKDALHASENN